jgi:DNA-binding Lrp family transcriptional regulator
MSLRPLPDEEVQGGSPAELSALDRRIFQELQQDGRIPFVALAQKLGVSEAHVRRRVDRLTRADVFSITAVADPKALGIDCMAWLGVNAKEAHAGAVAEALVDIDEIDYVVQTSGAFNVMAEAACRSSSDLYRLIRRLRALPGVRRTETFIYLNLLRQQFQWSLEGAREGVRGDDVLLDDLDRELIAELQRDGRASFRAIGQRVGVSERLVSSRVARLIDERLLQVIAVGNPLRLGFGAMAWLGVRVREGAGVEETAAALAEVAAIDYVVLPAGRYDLMAELVCRTQRELLLTLERGVGEVPGIADVESFLYLRLLYRSAAGAWGASRSLTLSDEHGPLAERRSTAR